MPTLRTFARETGIKEKHWCEVYRRVREALALSPAAPPSEVALDSLLGEIQKYGVTVTAGQVVKALRDAGLGRLYPYLLDQTFTALPASIWDKVLAWSDVDAVQYVSERRDCDNFAVALAGQIGLRLRVNGVGVVVDYSGRHAYNVLLVGDQLVGGPLELKARLIEPQSDRTVNVGDKLSGHEAYKAAEGFILFP